jgi:hypothetical protein
LQNGSLNKLYTLRKNLPSTVFLNIPSHFHDILHKPSELVQLHGHNRTVQTKKLYNDLGVWCVFSAIHKWEWTTQGATYKAKCTEKWPMPCIFYVSIRYSENEWRALNLLSLQFLKLIFLIFILLQFTLYFLSPAKLSDFLADNTNSVTATFQAVPL